MRSQRARVLLAVTACLLAGLAVGYFVSGAILYKLAIDLDSPSFPFGAALQAAHDALGLGYPRPVAGVVWLALSFLVVLAGSFWWARRAARGGAAGADPERRRVLAGVATGAGAALGATVLAAGGAAARAIAGVGNGGRGWGRTFSEIFGGDVVKTNPVWLDEWKGARVKAHRRFGRTGWEISDIVVGGGRLQGEQGAAIVRLALDRGVNYVDTSPDYSSTGSEQAVAEGIRGRRDQVFLATKFCTPRGHLGPGASVADYMGVVEASLSRLGTDHVDLVHIHSCDEVERLMDPNCHEAFDRLKEQGKARFLGFSSHTPNLVQVAEQAIASGRFDVMMLAYHHGIWPRLGEVITRARSERDMGVIAMKTLKGAKHDGLAGFREHAASYSQAALRWVLSNPDVSAAIISFFEFQHVDEYLSASGGAPTAADRHVLREYDRQIVGSYCAPHCGDCLASCPEGVPIPDVLRHRMYFEDYRNEKEAMRLYARLETDASACAGCSAPCLGACTLGIPIAERTRGAHELLTLS